MLFTDRTSVPQMIKSCTAFKKSIKGNVEWSKLWSEVMETAIHLTFHSYVDRVVDGAQVVLRSAAVISSICLSHLLDLERFLKV